MADVTQVI